MPTLILEQGETLHVELADCDGTFTITFSEAITVNVDMPDDLKREGEIYRASPDPFDGDGEVIPWPK